MHITKYDIKQILDIVRSFIRDHKLVCYGGMAINQLVTKKNPADSFYGDNEIPDYDIYCPRPYQQAIQLTNLIYKKYPYVEAKSSVHLGTYKIFVNGTPLVDMTYVPAKIYRTILSTSYLIQGIRYAHPNYLRISLYFELCRPLGNIARWEKNLSTFSVTGTPLSFPQQ